MQKTEKYEYTNAGQTCADITTAMGIAAEHRICKFINLKPTETKLVKSIIFLAVCVFCKIGYSQEIPELHTHYVDKIQRVVVLSGDTVYDVIKEITNCGGLFFSDVVGIDSISSELIIKHKYWFIEIMGRASTIVSETIEVRHSTTILSEQTDTISNLFAKESEDVSRDVFLAQVKTSYLINILEQNGLIVQSDSLWIMVLPGHTRNSDLQYHIYQYCGYSRVLYLSVISFAENYLPKIVFADSTTRLNRNELKNINHSITRFHNHQINCINSNTFAALVFRSHGKYTGIFQSFRCDMKRGFSYGFFPIRNIHFKEAPRIHW